MSPEIPSIKDTSFTVDDLSSLAERGVVFDQVVTKKDLPEEAKRLLPQGFLDLTSDDQPWIMFTLTETGQQGPEIVE